MLKRDNIFSRLPAFLCMFLMGMALWPSLTFSEDVSVDNISVLSLDYCADQYALFLADPDQIVAVSKAAGDVYSFYRERAIGLPTTNSTIEEVIKLNPDIVLQTYSLAAHMPEITKLADITLIETKYGSDPETVYQNVSLVGNAFGQDERAQKFNQKYKRRMDDIQSKEPSKLRIVYVTPSGTTSGVGTSVDDIIKLSGFESYAAVKGYNGWISLPLEDLILDPPDMFITSFFDNKPSSQSTWSLSRHGHLYKMMENIPTVNLPSSYMACNGLFTIDAAEHIRIQATNIGLIKSESLKNE
jgi:iron complex transport system substrate-binding protein